VAEERFGRYISHRRSEYFLASKCGCVAGDLAKNPPPARAGQRSPHIFTAENVVQGVNQSLQRMKTEYLDLVQFHSSPSRAELEEHGGLEALQDLQRQGKVRFIGISGTIPNLKEQIEMGVFDAFQIPYSALERAHETLIEEASAAGAGIIVRGGAAKGGPGKEQGDFWTAWQRVGIDDLLGDMSRQEFILRFTISHPDLDTTIVGTINPEHLQDNVTALLAGPLPADVYAEAKRRLADAGSEPITVPAT
jgi:aryl-alcohol dehydrogenase-like predicted oxidoreductase